MKENRQTSASPDELERALERLARLLVDERRARVIIPANRAEKGYWFGAGSMVEDKQGNLYLSGRYRNAGDSRTGLELGDRGNELAVFMSPDKGATWRKIVSLGKKDVAPDGAVVLSIEGSALRFTEKGVQLFVSSEKEARYPAAVSEFLKSGTGVWSIDCLSAPTVEGLQQAKAVPFLKSDDPECLHVKDPFVYEPAGDGEGGKAMLFFCHHPFCWSSSNAGFVKTPLSSGAQFSGGPRSFQASDVVWNFFPRGRTWDVAISRATCVLDVPAIGAFQGRKAHLLFYDGGECMRNLDEHAKGVHRPRGYSCEELGGVAYFESDGYRPSNIKRLSNYLPMFVSPHGTGASRYVSVLKTKDGYYVTWQQSQADFSQPLVMNFVELKKGSDPFF